MKTEQRSVSTLTRTEEQRTSSGHSPLILQSETADLVQGSVVGEMDAVCALVYYVEPEDEQLLQAIHSELNLSAARCGV